LDDVQVMGTWNCTLQGDTPVYWLRCGQLDRYLLKFRVSSPCPATFGVLLHCEVDGPGTDGASFWVERRQATDRAAGSKRYMLAGDGLDSKPIATRSFPDPGGEQPEEVEVMMEGYNGTILLQNRKVSLRFRMKHSAGSVAFYNSTIGDSDEVHFSGARITALRRGPLEIDGKLLRRERELERLDNDGRLYSQEAQAGDVPGEIALDSPFSPAVAAKAHRASFSGHFAADSAVSTMAPDSLAPRTRSTFTVGGGGSTIFGGISVSEFNAGPQPSAGRPAVPAAAQTLPAALPAAPRRSRAPSPGGGSPASPARRLGGRVASEGALRRTAGASPISAASASMLRMGSRPRQQQWVPLSLNAPSGEQALLKGVSRRKMPLNNACTDFIPIAANVSL